jgi:pilus assembly protein CpaC
MTIFCKTVSAFAVLAATSGWYCSLSAQIPPLQSPSAFTPANSPEQQTAAAYDVILKVVGKKANMKIVEQFAKVVEIENKIVRVDGFDPAIINVTALTPNRIRVQAVKPGISTLVLVDEYGETYSIDVFVTGDVRHLQAYIDRLFPRSSVEAIAVEGSVLLGGWVTQPEHITDLVEVAQQFYPNVLNQMKVAGVQQVLLKVRVMEVQRSKIRRLGFNFLKLTENAFFASTPGELAPILSFDAPFGGPPGLIVNTARLVDSTLLGGIVSDNSVFNGFLEALKQESLLKILAEPRLVLTNGKPAIMLSGGSFPILVPQSLGTTSIEYRDFGVRLEAVAIILGQGRVRLELQSEVSEQDFTSSVTVGGITVPGLTIRRVNTQVEMKFGETFMLTGLLSTKNTAETSKVPLLGEIPWLGVLFRRVRDVETETETVIMVTPELVSPLQRGQVPPRGPGLFSDKPTMRELYIGGLLEVPWYGDHCEGCDPLDSPIVPAGGFVPTPDSLPGSPVAQPGLGPSVPQGRPGSLLLPPLPATKNRDASPPTQPPQPAYDVKSSGSPPWGHGTPEWVNANKKFGATRPPRSRRSTPQRLADQSGSTFRRRSPGKSRPAGNARRLPPLRKPLAQKPESGRSRAAGAFRFTPPGLIEPKPRLIQPPSSPPVASSQERDFPLR